MYYVNVACYQNKHNTNHFFSSIEFAKKENVFYNQEQQRRKIVTINEFLEQSGITKRDFAKIIGCQYTHFVSVSNGQRRPSVKLAQKIEEKTMGLVKKEKLIFG